MTRTRTADPGRRLRREAWGFAAGSLCFLVGALPPYAGAVGAVATGVTFVVGSVFFTAAGGGRLGLCGRRPRRAGAPPAGRGACGPAAVQLVGTLCFNVSTTAALVAAVKAPTALWVGWRPDAYGSVAFLVSSALAVLATRDRGHLWDTDARTWHGTWLNMIGSVAFAASAVGAYVDPSTGTYLSAWWDDAGTLLGAVCFLAAALLSRRSAGAPARTDAVPAG